MSEEVDLPRKEVEGYLEDTSPELCAKYLDYIIEERQPEETATSFHLYLLMKLAAKKPKDEEVTKTIRTRDSSNLLWTTQ
ncbi:hypothetical protein D9613_011915 [Agrocybe pediades]|uniref:Uncharacterized protein n=1 Tax=Agrocybe pediades TaxID=84607 RepID=A0A8H4VHV5_9AGAR|nr:hypothetical protein D9613_011915 [Agrocybe pediades]